MVHNQTNADTLRKLSVTFLENVWLARMTLKVKMERNRFAHHVPNALQKINYPWIAIWQRECKEGYSGDG